jgi:cytochrome c oxidase subunit 2
VTLVNLCSRFLLFAGLMMLAGCHPTAAEPPLTGADLFRACDSCHGDKGQGDPVISAPAIAGLPKWYVLMQLDSFRTGMRGAHPDDIEGLRMRPMSRQMKSRAELDTVAEYVSKLPAQKPAPTVKGDAKKGQVSFQTCSACHGPDGKGNEALKAPRINAQHGWYLISQLRKFKAGVRGFMPGDTAGATMRPMAMTLPDEAAFADVVAYIETLPATN